MYFITQYIITHEIWYQKTSCYILVPYMHHLGQMFLLTNDSFKKMLMWLFVGIKRNNLKHVIRITAY